MSNDAIVIVNGARTPMGSFQGALQDVSASDLGATAIKAAVERAGISVDSVDEVIRYTVIREQMETNGVFDGEKKIDIENARKPEISKDSESKFTKGEKTQK